MRYRLHITIQYFFITVLVLNSLTSIKIREPDTIRLRLMSENILILLNNISTSYYYDRTLTRYKCHSIQSVWVFFYNIYFISHSN